MMMQYTKINGQRIYITCDVMITQSCGTVTCALRCITGSGCVHSDFRTGPGVRSRSPRVFGATNSFGSLVKIYGTLVRIMFLNA